MIFIIIFEHFQKALNHFGDHFFEVIPLPVVVILCIGIVWGIHESFYNHPYQNKDKGDKTDGNSQRKFDSNK